MRAHTNERNTNAIFNRTAISVAAPLAAIGPTTHAVELISHYQPGLHPIRAPTLVDGDVIAYSTSSVEILPLPACECTRGELRHTF